DVGGGDVGEACGQLVDHRDSAGVGGAGVGDLDQVVDLAARHGVVGARDPVTAEPYDPRLGDGQGGVVIDGCGDGVAVVGGVGVAGGTRADGRSVVDGVDLGGSQRAG